MLYDETWSVKEEEVIRLDRHDTRWLERFATSGPRKGFLKMNLGLD